MNNAQQPTASIPGHELLEQIARGSYGEIWLARTELGAVRAVKIIRRATFADARPYDREFAGIQRYEPVSREHDGLVDVLQIGRDEQAGYFYYVMELADDAGGARVEGHGGGREKRSPAPFASCSPASYVPLTLAHAIRTRTHLPASEVVALGITLARALEFLHSRRLLHRDVKPQNIIFVASKPKLADVGLVAEVDGPQTLVGTDGYIPPEGPGTAQADIYSLGKVLYEAATGKDRQEFPDLDLPPDTPPDSALLELNEVLLKACESNPRARYRTAGDMVADLERIEAGHSLRASRQRCHTVRTFAVGGGVVAGIALLAVGLAALVQSERSKPRLLFSDAFDGAQIDTNRWTWSQKTWFGEAGVGHPSCRVAQLGGELILRTKADHERSSVGQAVWVDFQPDLRETPCRLEITLAGSTSRGLMALYLTQGDTPVQRYERGRAELDICLADKAATNGWGNRTLLVDLLPKSQIAIVRKDTNRLDQFEVLDLRSLPIWRLRFYCAAWASKSFPGGESELHVESFAGWTRVEDECFVGRAIEETSGSPVAGAAVYDVSGKVVTRTLGNGAFRVTLPAKGPFKVAKAGYQVSDNQPPEPPSAGSQRHFQAIRLRKINPSFGDVVEAIPCGQLDVRDIGFRAGSLLALTHDSISNCSLRAFGLPLDGTSSCAIIQNLDLGSKNLIDSFAECGKRLIGIKPWPGTLFDLGTDSHQSLLQLTNAFDAPIDWPRGCAFDGELLWFLESDDANDRHCLHALNLRTLKVTYSLTSGDKQMYGLAWDGQHFWISSGEGAVYAVNREDAIKSRTVAAGRRRGFPGNYVRLAFDGNHLWGLQPERSQICKIKITD